MTKENTIEGLLQAEREAAADGIEFPDHLRSQTAEEKEVESRLARKLDELHHEAKRYETELRDLGFDDEMALLQRAAEAMRDLRDE